MTTSSKRGCVGLEGKRADRISSLVADLAKPDPAVRTKAREALVAIGKRTVPSLIQLLSHRKSHIRWEAAKALCGIADPIAAFALVNALDDRNGDVRWLAAEGVAALGRDGLEPLLAALLQRAQSCWFCEACAPHLSHFGQEGKARSDSAACIGGPETIRAGSCCASGCLYRTIETPRVVVRTRSGLVSIGPVSLMKEPCHAK